MSSENVESEGQDQREVREEDVQALVEGLRVAPAEQILAEVLSTLLSTAQVKLGRRDARLFIDLCALIAEHAGDVVSGELRGQVDAALGQLRMGQVAAEREVATAGEPEPNDLPRTPPAPSVGDPGRAGSADPPGSSSGLWVPGR